MRVIVNSSVFNGTRGPPFFGILLVDAACLNTHALDLSFDPEFDPTFLAWRGRLSATDSEAVDAVIRNSRASLSREHFDSVVVADASESNWSANPPIVGGNELISLLRAPLNLLVENAENDGAMLRQVALGVDGDNFRNAIDSRQIVFEHGGGSSVATIIEDKRNDPIWKFRSWVVVDSDAFVPGSPSADCQRKQKDCALERIRFHALARRAMENYLPHAELDEHHKGAQLPLRLAIGAYGRLSLAQRSHFNMKSGFGGDAAALKTADPKLVEQTKSLFSTVSGLDRRALDRGFGQTIGALFRDRAPISESRLRHDQQHHETEPLFQRIMRSR